MDHATETESEKFAPQENGSRKSDILAVEPPSIKKKKWMTLPSITQQNVIMLLLFATLFSFLLFSYRLDKIPPTSECLQKTLNIEVEPATTLKKEIPALKQTILLVWNWPWGETFDLDKCESDFGISGCTLTVDRSVYDKADAVIMHHADIMGNMNALPKQPRPNFQRWVWFNLEPPLIINSLEMFDNVFNMTMTFRQDSDFFNPYGRLETLREPQNFTIPYNKTKLVAWVVSKWYPGVRRISFYEEFKKHIEIDLYGSRGKPLGWGEFHSTLGQYKFYLSFENSMYKDYITEKLWRNAFGSWAVPVVLGTTRANYERFVPGDSFIHVDDFSSPKELADYLHQLDKDDEKYLKYFSWRSRYIVKMFGYPYMFCTVCAGIKQSPKFQTAHNISGWFLKNL